MAGLAFQRCNGFAERTFTFVKMTDGSLQRAQHERAAAAAVLSPHPSRNASFRRKMRSVR